MVLNKLILTVSTVGICSGIEKIMFNSVYFGI